MRVVRSCLAALLGLFVMAGVGAGEAKAQNSLIRVCNYTAQAADVVVAGLVGGQYVIKGWWTALMRKRPSRARRRRPHSNRHPMRPVPPPPARFRPLP